MKHFTKTHHGVDVTIIPALTDNYIYVISYGDRAAVIDPAEAEPVKAFLEEKKLQLECVINTHHHLDHIGGNAGLKAQTECRVIGPDHEGIPGLDKVVSEGRVIKLGKHEMRALETPGHARRDLSYYMPRAGIVWTGDTMFMCGCGRLFECDAREMWESLTKLAALPDKTIVYCGHNYTHDNLLFAQSVDPENEQLAKRLKIGRGAYRKR